ncbi:GntR family transcriptional regulator [Radiobacillus kanasensis]|uniref:GntR family transcriptional regulator n=1 Tax=Radiobacillus kanasensis TaxID=2844358 RepID=UPI001E3D851D|nr:GntR family transcriptional regulator [Radiobacillus kanasensis]UFT99766.1 GntR family transcriptional regulator [Radiobacillus kanasensis]
MKTKHRIVREYIQSKILDGTFSPNEKIGSESEFMERFQVSRHTVRLAIGDLVNQGWLYRKQGAGTYCAARSELGQMDKNHKNIALITTNISDYIFPSIIQGAESYLSKHGYNVSLFSTDNDHKHEKEVLEKILTHPIDGVIIEPTKSALSNPNIHYFLNLEKSDIPYVMINAYYDELEPFSITIDDVKGGFIQTEHLIMQGHQNILGFFKTDDLQGTRRMKGYIKAHRSHQLQINPSNIITYHTEEKSTKPVDMLEKILLRPGQTRPTAIVCYNDELALLLLDVLRKQKLKIPKDISLIGYDDSILSQVSEVKLTTIKHPQAVMGEVAARKILEVINDRVSIPPYKGRQDSITYEPELVIRNSTNTFETPRIEIQTV